MKGSSHSVGPTRVLSHPELRESSQKPQNWIRSTIAIIFLTVIFVLTASSAQTPGQPGTSDTHTQQQTQSGNPQQTEVSGPSPASTIVTEEKEKTKKKKPDRRGSILNCSSSDCESGNWQWTHPNCWLHFSLQQGRQAISSFDHWSAGDGYK
jgi:hypothetical protein